MSQNLEEKRSSVPGSLRTSEPVPPVWIEVNLDALKKNFNQIRSFVAPKVKILTVVKANAYGHGLVPVARRLAESGADLLGVASVAEGVALRQAGLTQEILVLGTPLPDEAELIVRNDLTQAVGDEVCAQALSETASRLSKTVSLHMKVDTGMGRYGVWHTEAVDLARQIKGFPAAALKGVFTHFAKAGLSTEASRVQLNHFQDLIKALEAEGLEPDLTHIANSVGTIRFQEAHLNLVRTGLLVYGASPLRDGKIPFKLTPVLSLKSRIRFLKRVPAGRSISYGGTFKTARPTTIATIPVGYAHGFSRALSNKAELLIRGMRARVVGVITMEDLMVDVTDVPDAAMGDEVVLIGSQGPERVSAETLARHAGTIPYEILASLSPRIPRIYL